jgi:hypothetical protein
MSHVSARGATFPLESIRAAVPLQASCGLAGSIRGSARQSGGTSDPGTVGLSVAASSPADAFSPDYSRSIGSPRSSGRTGFGEVIRREGILAEGPIAPLYTISVRFRSHLGRLDTL